MNRQFVTFIGMHKTMCFTYCRYLELPNCRIFIEVGNIFWDWNVAPPPISTLQVCQKSCGYIALRIVWLIRVFFPHEDLVCFRSQLKRSLACGNAEIRLILLIPIGVLRYLICLVYTGYVRSRTFCVLYLTIKGVVRAVMLLCEILSVPCAVNSSMEPCCVWYEMASRGAVGMAKTSFDVVLCPQTLLLCAVWNWLKE